MTNPQQCKSCKSTLIDLVIGTLKIMSSSDLNIDNMDFALKLKCRNCGKVNLIVKT